MTSVDRLGPPTAAAPVAAPCTLMMAAGQGEASTRRPLIFFLAFSSSFDPFPSLPFSSLPTTTTYSNNRDPDPDPDRDPDPETTHIDSLINNEVEVEVEVELRVDTGLQLSATSGLIGCPRSSSSSCCRSSTLCGCGQPSNLSTTHNHFFLHFHFHFIQVLKRIRNKSKQQEEKKPSASNQKIRLKKKKKPNNNNIKRESSSFLSTTNPCQLFFGVWRNFQFSFFLFFFSLFGRPRQLFQHIDVVVVAWLTFLIWPINIDLPSWPMGPLIIHSNQIYLPTRLVNKYNSLD